jgi:hypothetical protein
VLRHEKESKGQGKKPEGGTICGPWEIPEKCGETRAMVKPVSARPGKAQAVEKRSPRQGRAALHLTLPPFIKRYQMSAREGILYRKMSVNSPLSEKLISGPPWAADPERKRRIYRMAGSNKVPNAAPAYNVLFFCDIYYTIYKNWI